MPCPCDTTLRASHDEGSRRYIFLGVCGLFDRFAGCGYEALKCCLSLHFIWRGHFSVSFLIREYPNGVSLLSKSCCTCISRLRRDGIGGLVAAYFAIIVVLVVWVVISNEREEMNESLGEK